MTRSLAEYLKYLENYSAPTIVFQEPVDNCTAIGFDPSGSMESSITDQEERRAKEAFEKCISEMHSGSRSVDYTIFMKKPEELK